MTPDRLACELAVITRDLLAASDVEQFEPLLARRAALVAELSRCDSAAFSHEGAEQMNAALQDGAAAERKIAAFRLRAAEECGRVNALRSTAPAHPSAQPSVSIIG